MIKHEPFVLDTTEYDYVYSDALLMIKRDDGKELYDDLILPGTHTYEETDRKIGEKPIDENEQALKILLGLEV